MKLKVHPKDVALKKGKPRSSFQTILEETSFIIKGFYVTCIIRIRACPNPNSFFDDLIPEGGLELEDWKLRIQQIPMPGTADDGSEVWYEVRWLYAEMDCDPNEIKTTLNKKKPELLQHLRALSGMRRSRIKGSVSFTMCFDEYVKDGVQGNIEPYFLDVGINIINYRAIDSNGKVIFDAEEDEKERTLERERLNLQTKSKEIKDFAKHARFISDPYYRKAWESYNLAHDEHDHAIGHLYEVREAAKARVKQVRLLNLIDNEWSRFGQILNDNPVQGGRHNGNKPDLTRALTRPERQFLMNFSEKVLLALGDFLEKEETKRAQEAKPDIQNQ